MKYYTVDILGKKVDLPILQFDNGIKICFFNLHGNVELTEYCAKKLSLLLEDSEVLLTAESKGLQLTHCIARNLGQKFYAVARKSKKLYMQDGISTTIKSITTGLPQTLYLSAHDSALLKNKKVTIVDDVISSGGSVKGLSNLVQMSGGTVYKIASVLAEGEAKKRKDIIFLAEIPLNPQ